MKKVNYADCPRCSSTRKKMKGVKHRRPKKHKTVKIGGPYQWGSAGLQDMQCCRCDHKFTVRL